MGFSWVLTQWNTVLSTLSKEMLTFACTLCLCLYIGGAATSSYHIIPREQVLMIFLLIFFSDKERVAIIGFCYRAPLQMQVLLITEGEKRMGLFRDITAISPFEWVNVRQPHHCFASVVLVPCGYQRRAGGTCFGDPRGHTRTQSGFW